MAFGYRLIHALSRMVDFGYSRVVQGAFARCGKDTRIGRHARLVCPHLVEIGSQVVIGEYAWLNAKDDRGTGGATLTIRDGVYIGRFVQINAWRSVIIGRDAMIGDRVFISDADHNYANSSIPVRSQGDRFVGEIELMEGCWVGIGAVLLPGVTIGRNAVVAANSLVTRSVPDRTIVGGVPARTIGLLDEDTASDLGAS
jgi:acetyltransferase-like isoleucine patch superfamily enzyme